MKIRVNSRRFIICGNLCESVSHFLTDNGTLNSATLLPGQLLTERLIRLPFKRLQKLGGCFNAASEQIDFVSVCDKKVQPVVLPRVYVAHQLAVIRVFDQKIH